MPSSVDAVKNTASLLVHCGQRTSRVRGSVGSDRTSCRAKTRGAGGGEGTGVSTGAGTARWRVRKGRGVTREPVVPHWDGLPRPVPCC